MIINGYKLQNYAKGAYDGMESIVVGVDMLRHIENVAVVNPALHGLLVSLVHEGNRTVAGGELGIVKLILAPLEFFEQLAHLLDLVGIEAIDVLLPHHHSIIMIMLGDLLTVSISPSMTSNSMYSGRSARSFF